MGSYSRRLSRTQRRWSTRHQIDMAWLASPGRPQRDVAIHGDDLCATSVITPCVQSANLRGTHSSPRRGILLVSFVAARTCDYNRAIKMTFMTRLRRLTILTWT